ncbi:MAG: hypothetical protein Q8K58_09790 [Acidimicrobiales bacterium]|nr:hypothetical protein [Acidimicrobiales bacterium]
MPTVGITDECEGLHPVEDPSEHWSDSLYFNAWDPATDAFVMTRIAVKANASQVTAGMVVWLAGQPVYGYGDELDEIPPTDWDVMSVGAITYRMLESRQRWVVQLAGADGRAHLEWEGLSPATAYDGHPAGGLPQAVAWGHYEQSCRVTGDLEVGGRRIRFDGFGQRDHSWGHRHWAGLHQWHWVTGFLRDGRAFNLFEVHEHHGVPMINGFVRGPDGDEYVVASAREHELSDDGGTEHYRVVLQLASGEALEVTGERAGLSIPVRPAADQPVTVHETPMRLRAGDGTEGYGIYEHLVTEFE